MAQHSETSRYYNIKENLEILQEELFNYSISYSTTYVLLNERNSPEIISQRVYNNPNWWWLICRFNGIINPNNIPAGLEIKIPNIDEFKR